MADLTPNADKLIDIPTPRQEKMPIAEFLKLKPFPGARNSELRAQTATHLFKLAPEHTEVALAELPDGTLFRLTGNTRASVWLCNLSDKIPTHLAAYIYPCATIQDVSKLGTHFDSREAAWSVADHAYRAFGIAYGGAWYPNTLARAVTMTGALRQAAAFVAGYYTPESITSSETTMLNWKEEIRLLDQLLDAPNDLSGKPFRTLNLSAILIILRYANKEKVMAWARSALRKEGTIDEQGYDGVALLSEALQIKPKRGRSKNRVREPVEQILGAWKIHDEHGRVEKPGTPKKDKIDPLDFIKKMTLEEPGKKFLSNATSSG